MFNYKKVNLVLNFIFVIYIILVCYVILKITEPKNF